MRTAIDFLEDIVGHKRQRVRQAQQTVPLNELSKGAFAARRGAEPFALRSAITKQKGRPAIIAEFKRASPSKGEMRIDADAGEFARTFQNNGAAAVSVVTEEDFFRGSLDDLETVKAAVSVPILRKDFIVDAYQVFETAAAGADAALLIAAALNDEQLRGLRWLAEDELQMDALVEVHTEFEMERAIESGATFIGVNNRDLRTFNVSLDLAERILALAPPEAIIISESGLSSRADLKRLTKAGCHGFLIGEALMRADDPGGVLRALLGE